MKNYGVITSLFLLCINVLCQSKEVPVKSIHKLRVTKFLVKRDSSIKEYDKGSIAMRKFFIMINKAFFDDKSNELQLTGQVCVTTDTLNCLGIPNVSIFKAIRSKNNIISSSIELARSSYDKDNLEKNGFFDIKYKIAKGESLFFLFTPDFYLEEFKIDKLLGNKR